MPAHEDPRANANALAGLLLGRASAARQQALTDHLLPFIAETEFKSGTWEFWRDLIEYVDWSLPVIFEMRRRIAWRAKDCLQMHIGDLVRRDLKAEQRREMSEQFGFKIS